MPPKQMVGDLLELAASSKCCSDFRWLSSDAFGKGKNSEEMSEKEKLDLEVQSAGLQYRDPPTPKDGNCMFHAIRDQLARLGLTLNTPSQLRSSVVQYLQNNPPTSDGTHLREFTSYQAWESYLRRMSQDSVLGGVDYSEGPCKHAQYRHSRSVKYRRGWPESDKPR